MSLGPGTLDLTVYQGDSFTLSAIWEIDGSPVDVTGYTAALQVRKTHDAAPLLDLTSETPGAGQIQAITLGGVAGTITVEVDGADTAGLDFRKARYDLELTDAGGTGEVRTLLAGAVSLTREITAT